jgi:hypothetical protein
MLQRVVRERNAATTAHLYRNVEEMEGAVRKNLDQDMCTAQCTESKRRTTRMYNDGRKVRCPSLLPWNRTAHLGYLEMHVRAIIDRRKHQHVCALDADH